MAYSSVFPRTDPKFELRVGSRLLEETKPNLTEEDGAHVLLMCSSVCFGFSYQLDCNLLAAGPCGHFVPVYRSMCAYFGCEQRVDLVWDIENILAPQEIRTFDLGEFDELSGKDIQPLLASLRHNTWFKRLEARNMRYVGKGPPDSSLPSCRLCLPHNAVVRFCRFPQEAANALALCLGNSKVLPVSGPWCYIPTPPAHSCPTTTPHPSTCSIWRSSGS
jgi:hypothetical protein